MSRDPKCFTTDRDAALALLNGGVRLTRRAGQFLGGIVAGPSGSLSDAQAKWLDSLLKKADLPCVDPDGGQ